MGADDWRSEEHLMTAIQPRYTVEIEALPLPRNPLVPGVPIEPVPTPLPRDCPTIEAALGNAGVLAQEGYRVKITGPEGVWDHIEVLRRLNAPSR
jgi:hypothetical protein